MIAEQSRDVIERVDLENWVRQIIEDPTLEPFFQDWLEDRGWSRDLHEIYLLNSCCHPDVFIRKKTEKDTSEYWLEEEIWDKLSCIYHQQHSEDLKYFHDKEHAWVELLIAVNS